MSRSPASAILADFRFPLLGVGLLSAAVNVLYLTGSFFMLEVYDRVIPSRSVPTLVGLCVIAALLYGFQGLIDVLRGRVLLRVGAAMDERLAPRLMALVAAQPLSGHAEVDGLQPLRDLDQVRSFVSGGGPAAFFDLPWMPFYIAICWAFHPSLGLAILAGAAILFALALASEILARAPARQAAKAGAARMALAGSTRQNAEIVRALGMSGRMVSRWTERNAVYRHAQMRASDVSTSLAGVSKVVRMALQSGVLALGAWLVIRGEATSGIIIAASILTARALAPVELAIANWKGFVAMRESRSRLSALLARSPEGGRRTSLPEPVASLFVEGLTATPPGSTRIVVRNVGFSLRAGQGVGIVGPSGSGKSSLARLLVGVWAPVSGKVRLDGAAIEQWDPDALGRHVGYLPQDVELFDGTVAENIARFDPDATDAAVIAAAKAAGVHDLVVSLPDGYDTRVGEGGATLSAGQRQRVALARALFGNPFLVVLDEPNSNLDAEGERALTQAILDVRARGGIAVVIAHRPGALAGVDHILAMGEGGVVAFAPKHEYLRKAQDRRPLPLSSRPLQRAAGLGAAE